MIKSHLYVKFADAPVFERPEESPVPKQRLSRGNWVGVIERVGDWVKVVGVYFTGWVKAEQLESRPPLDLHIEQSETQSIQYINTVG